MWEIFLDISAWVLPVLTAVILHEIAHGYVAGKLGDPTARLMGRITLNPLRHIDPVGTVAFPAILIAVGSPVVFGSAKPVPVNFKLLHPARLGMALVAIAGPATNLILAFICALALHIELIFRPEEYPWLFANLYRAISLNCMLAAFNMLPILPLDGGRVVAAMLRGKAAYYWSKLERFGLPILVIILLLPPYLGFDALSNLLLKPSLWLLETIIYITGNSQ